MTAVLPASDKPAQATSSVVAGIIGAVFHVAGIALSRRPSH
ncbi:hypothetical protein ACWGN5_39380 [Streptomyces sp. NPDC055815]